jgi:hypothetical protein
MNWLLDGCYFYFLVYNAIVNTFLLHKKQKITDFQQQRNACHTRLVIKCLLIALNDYSVHLKIVQ